MTFLLCFRLFTNTGLDAFLKLTVEKNQPKQIIVRISRVCPERHLHRLETFSGFQTKLQTFTSKSPNVGKNRAKGFADAFPKREGAALARMQRPFCLAGKRFATDEHSAALPLRSAERLAFPKVRQRYFEATPQSAGIACRRIWVLSPVRRALPHWEAASRKASAALWWRLLRTLVGPRRSW